MAAANGFPGPEQGYALTLSMYRGGVVALTIQTMRVDAGNVIMQVTLN